MNKPIMTQSAIEAAITQVVADLGLGPNSVRRSSWYHDYACFSFACYPSITSAAGVQQRFQGLCDACGWTECEVTADVKRNMIMVTMSQSHIISTTERRMP